MATDEQILITMALDALEGDEFPFEEA